MIWQHFTIRQFIISINTHLLNAFPMMLLGNYTKYSKKFGHLEHGMLQINVTIKITSLLNVLQTANKFKNYTNVKIKLRLSTFRPSSETIIRKTLLYSFQTE